MYDLDVQIRDYVDATSAPLTVDEVLHVPVGDEPVRPFTPRGGGRRPLTGWLVAGAAAAIVVLVIGAVGLFAALRSGGESVVEPTTSTTVVRGAATSAIAESFTQARSDGDVDAVVALLAEDASVDMGPAAAPSDIPAEMRWQHATGLTFTFGRCEPVGVPTDGSNASYSCFVAWTGAVAISLGHGTDTFEYAIDVFDDRIVSVALVDLGGYQETTWQPFRDWMRENHPSDMAALYTTDGHAVLADESVDLWRRYTAEFVAEQATQLTGPIVWSNPVDAYPFARVYELPDGGFLTVSVIGEGPDLYSGDGRAWVDAAETGPFYAEHQVVWVQGSWAVVVGVGEDRNTAEHSLAHYRDGSWRLVASVGGSETDWEGMASFEGTSVFMEHGSDADVVWIGDDQSGVVRKAVAPWPVSDVEDGWRQVPVLTVDGVGFFAYPLDFFNDGTENGVFGTTDTAGIWASADGVAWERHSDNPFAPPGVSHLQMDTVGTTLWATVHTGGTAALPNDYFAYWSSIDGVTWAVEGEAVNGQADVLEQELFAEPTLTRTGLIRSFGDALQRSTDGGVTWTAIPGPPVECRGRMGEAAISLVGDFLYCGGYDGFWVGHFDA